MYAAAYTRAAGSELWVCFCLYVCLGEPPHRQPSPECRHDSTSRHNYDNWGGGGSLTSKFWAKNIFKIKLNRHNFWYQSSNYFPKLNLVQCTPKFIIHHKKTSCVAVLICHECHSFEKEIRQIMMLPDLSAQEWSNRTVAEHACSKM